jgi:serine protease Do
MNNEFNNNQSGEYTDSNAYPDNTNMDNSANNAGNSTGSFDNSYSTGNIYSNNNAGQVNDQANNNMNYNPYTVYPTLAVSEEKKPKKKRKIPGAFKLTAAAVAFGLIAGGTFQGYYMVAHLNDAAQSDKIQIAQVSQTDSKGDTITPTNTSTEGVVTDVSDVVSKVMPSIVAINSTADVTNYDFFGREYTQQSQASGSGIIIGQNDNNLLIATNNHVIDGAQSVEIVFSDNSKAPATVKGADANSDLAVLSVKMSDLSDKTAAAIKVASLGNSDNVKPGEMAIAIGNALGYGQSVTVGYISAVNREVDINNNKMSLLQTDAAINPGNSGGALLNADGQVIGINSIKYADTDVEGMGYAIPITKAIPMINELMNRESVATADQGFLGIDASSAQNVTQEYATRFNMPIGVYVNDVIKGSPAEAAGLVQGDIITGLDNSKVETIDDLVNALSYKKAGQQVKLVIQVKENGSYVEKTLDITLGKKN